MYERIEYTNSAELCERMAQEFKRFKAGFNGDPQQEVQRLLNSGKMTQQQFNQLYGIARQFQSLFEGL